MKNNRLVIVGLTVALVVIDGMNMGSTVLANEHDVPVAIANVNAEADTVTLTNHGSEEIDLSGYVIDWEHEGPKN